MPNEEFGQVLERLAKLLAEKKIVDQDPFPDEVEDVPDDEEG